MEGTQVGVHLTNDKTIQFLGQRELIRQGNGMPVAIDALVTVEGLNNFREQYSTGVGAVVSRRIARRLAVYVEPIWVANTNPLPGEETNDNHTFQVGLASRLRLGSRTYLVGEFVPRAVGYRPGGQLRLLRSREAVWGPPVLAELLERTRDDDGPTGARLDRPQRLVHWVQPEPQVLLTQVIAHPDGPAHATAEGVPGLSGIRRGLTCADSEFTRSFARQSTSRSTSSGHHPAKSTSDEATGSTSSSAVGSNGAVPPPSAYSLASSWRNCVKAGASNTTKYS